MIILRYNSWQTYDHKLALLTFRSKNKNIKIKQIYRIFTIYFFTLCKKTHEWWRDFPDDLFYSSQSSISQRINAAFNSSRHWTTDTSLSCLYNFVNSCSPGGATKLSTFSALQQFCLPLTVNFFYLNTIYYYYLLLKFYSKQKCALFSYLVIFASTSLFGNGYLFYLFFFLLSMTLFNSAHTFSDRYKLDRTVEML